MQSATGAAFEFAAVPPSSRVQGITRFSLPRVLAAHRLTPTADGNVGASRGEVDAGVLNAFVLAVEQVRVLSPFPSLVLAADRFSPS